jgi:expansin (peptidoglycan-binding protein)
MATLDEAVTALNAIETDNSDVQAQVAAALTAVQAAQSGSTVDVNDQLVLDITAAFEKAGFTVTVPVAPEIPATT